MLRTESREAKSYFSYLICICWDAVADAGHYLVSKTEDPDEPYCHGQDMHDFYQFTIDFDAAIKRDTTLAVTYAVKSLSKVRT